MDEEPSKPNWDFWLNVAEVELPQAVELSLGVEPGWFASATSDRFVRQGHIALIGQIQTRMSIARSHVAASRLTARRRARDPELPGARLDEAITLADFRTWGEALPKPLTFPDEYPRSDERPHATSGRWPWGNHETDLLRHLAAAGKRFWAGYNPDDPSTANTSATVIEWLENEGVSKRVAEIMAQILRADGLKAGPR